jgi:hypothetical protein
VGHHDDGDSVVCAYVVELCFPWLISESRFPWRVRH